MKKLFLLLTVLFGSFFIFNLVRASILISEVNPGITSSTDEYIELYNPSSSSVFVSDYSLKQLRSTGSIANLVNLDSIFLKPFGYFLVTSKDFTSITIDKVYSQSSNFLAYKDNGVLLYDDNNNILDSVVWGTVSTSLPICMAANNPSEGKSLVRLPDDEQGNGQDTDNCQADFIEIISNPQNSSNISRPLIEDVVPSSTSGANFYYWSFLKLNEIMLGPSEGNEWVELYNTGTTSLNLAGGFLCDSHGGGAENDSCKNLSGTIAPNSFFLFDLLTRSYLNNIGDSVFLKNSSSTIVDELVYGTDDLATPNENNSLARKSDGVDTDTAADWEITTTITSGAANIITVPVVPTVSGGGGGSATVTAEEKEAKITTTSTKKTTIKETAPKDTAKITWVLDFPYSAAPGEVVEFDAHLSADPRGGQLNFWWDFGGGNTTTGSQTVFSFVTSGVYTVKVFVTSTAGTVGNKEFKILIGEGLSVRNSPVLIGEILTKPDEDDWEYIEIFNTGSSTQDVSRWILRNKANKEYVLPLNTKILGGQTLVFYENVTHLHFDTDGDWLELLSPDEKIVDLVDLPKFISNPPDTPAETTKETATKTTAVKTTTTKSVGPLLNSLATALTGEKGQRVKVKGTVTALPGTFGVQYLYIFDGQNGMQVYQYKKDFPPLAVGDTIEVNGEISVSGNVKRIKISGKKDIDILATNNNVSPLSLDLESLVDEAAGSLVKVEGDITEIKSNYMYIDDGNTEAVIYFKQGAKIDKKKIQEGQKVSVVGVLENSKSGLQVWPRSDKDIVKTGVATEAKTEPQLKEANGEKEVAEKYLTATAGGLTTLLLGFLARARGAVVVGFGKRAISFAGRIIRRG